MGDKVKGYESGPFKLWLVNRANLEFKIFYDLTEKQNEM